MIENLKPQIPQPEPTTQFQQPKNVAVGDIVADKYEILEFIGVGGMGSVYKVYDSKMKRVVALKIMRTDQALNPRSVKRFKHEATSAGRILHPNSITVYEREVCSKTNLVYLSMEFLDGVSLSKVLEKEQKLSVGRSLHILIQACSAMAAAHRIGIYHRDIKPSNLMLINHAGDPDFVKVVDFGIAKIDSSENTDYETLTDTGAVVGSAHYMSPEQCRGGTIGQRSDIYSLGCVMYEVLTGEVAFKGEGSLPTAMRHLDPNDRPILNIDKLDADPKIKQMLTEVFNRCIAYDPKDRYQTIDDHKKALEAVELKFKQLSEDNSKYHFDSNLAQAQLSIAKKQRDIFSNLGLLGRAFQLKFIGSMALALMGFLVVGIGLTLAIFTYTYIPESYGQMLNQEMQLKPIIVRDRRQEEKDLSIRMQLIFKGDPKLSSQLAKAEYFKDLGDFNAATISFEDAFNSSKGLGLSDKELGAQIESEIAECYLFSSNLSQAKKFSEEALRTLQSLGSYNSISALLASLVRARVLDLSKEDAAAALEFQHMQRTVRGANIKGRIDQVAYGTSFWADFLRKRKQFEQAVAMYQLAEQRWSGFNEEGIYNRCAVLDQLALLQSDFNRFSFAKESLNKAISLIENSPGRTNISRAQLIFHLSQVEWKNHSYFAALIDRAQAKDLLKTK